MFKNSASPGAMSGRSRGSTFAGFTAAIRDKVVGAPVNLADPQARSDLAKELQPETVELVQLSAPAHTHTQLQIHTHACTQHAHTRAYECLSTETHAHTHTKHTYTQDTIKLFLQLFLSLFFAFR